MKRNSIQQSDSEWLNHELEKKYGQINVTADLLASSIETNRL